MSNFFWPNRLQHTRLSTPSLFPRVCSGSYPLSQWCYLTISSSASLFSFCLQSFSASGSFRVSRLSASGVQSTGVSASLLPMTIQGWFPESTFRIDWFDFLSVQGILKCLLQHHNSKVPIPQCSAFFMVQFSHPYMTWLLKKPWLWLYRLLPAKRNLCFNMLSRFVIAFLPRSKCLLILWLQTPSMVTLEPKKIKSITASTFSSSIWHEVMGLDAMILVFWMLSFKPVFSLSSHPHQEAL